MRATCPLRSCGAESECSSRCALPLQRGTRIDDAGPSSTAGPVVCSCPDKRDTDRQGLTHDHRNRVILNPGSPSRHAAKRSRFPRSGRRPEPAQHPPRPIETPSNTDHREHHPHDPCWWPMRRQPSPPTSPDASGTRLARQGKTKRPSSGICAAQGPSADGGRYWDRTRDSANGGRQVAAASSSEHRLSHAASPGRRRRLRHHRHWLRRPVSHSPVSAHASNRAGSSCTYPARTPRCRVAKKAPRLRFRRPGAS